MVDRGYRNPLESFFAMNEGHRVGQVERNFKIMETLDDVAGKPAGAGKNLKNSEDLCTFKSEAAGHDQPDIAGAENDHPLTGHKPFHIDQPLHRPGGIDPGRTVAGDHHLETAALPAAHRQDYGSRFHLKGSFSVHRFQAAVLL